MISLLFEFYWSSCHELILCLFSFRWWSRMVTCCVLARIPSLTWDRLLKNACWQINQNAEGCCLAAMKQNKSGGVVCAIRQFDHITGVDYNRQRGHGVGSWYALMLDISFMQSSQLLILEWLIVGFKFLVDPWFNLIFYWKSDLPGYHLHVPLDTSFLICVFL